MHTKHSTTVIAETLSKATGATWHLVGSGTTEEHLAHADAFLHGGHAPNDHVFAATLTPELLAKAQALFSAADVTPTFDSNGLKVTLSTEQGRTVSTHIKRQIPEKVPTAIYTVPQHHESDASFRARIEDMYGDTPGTPSTPAR